MNRGLLPILALTASICAGSAQANDAPRQTPTGSWPERKCAIYKDAANRLFAARGTKGMGHDFLKAHAEFVASGCTIRNVCPRSAEELAVANDLTILAMNANMASTFPPFACRR